MLILAAFGILTLTLVLLYVGHGRRVLLDGSRCLVVRVRSGVVGVEVVR